MNISFTLQKINQLTKPVFKGSVSSQFKNNSDSDTFELSVGYINDVHGSTNNMMRILSGLKGDLKLSAGDNYVGDEKNQQVHDATIKFLNLAKITASALGNHEFDTTQKDYSSITKDFNGDFLASNFNQNYLKNAKSEETSRIDLKNFINKSKVVEVKGEKIGLIGAAPIDMFERATHPNYHEDCFVDTIEDTVEDIKAEVKNLENQGINKIILLSHLGHKNDKIIAENVEGIDVVIGGHTHELVEGIKEGENLIYSKNGEPVVITEAGKNGNYFGCLNLEFDKNGVIKKVQNNLGETYKYSKNLIHQYIFNSILGKPEEIGYIKYAPEPVTSLIQENPHANFMCDAMREELSADIGLWNNSGTRNFFHEGAIDSSDIKDIAPFADRVSKAEVSEKTLVDMFKRAVKETYNTQGNKPGLLAVSGMTYTVNPDKKELTAMNIIDRFGKEHIVDINNPSEEKTYCVVSDSFIMSWGGDYNILCPQGECEEYPFNKDYLTCQYIKHLNKPIEINTTGRIKFEL